METNPISKAAQDDEWLFLTLLSSSLEDEDNFLRFLFIDFSDILL